ncbi:MAG TPA: cytochrome ubiquinol oxidase subunit I [Solirubrobacterales bacterium]|jgi:cytochrome d ubiquinol oxidase subunit I|nr:cytochrome ubiquinol oxidase subunit I [Solirubrobacterales bacterium]
MSRTTLLDLSRWQWALTAAFHITFPAVTVGTSVLLVVCYAMYMRTENTEWLRMFRFWRKIFAIGFAIGVVSGIVLTFEFGLNWGRFAHDVGPIVGVAILMEVVMAFFLEAGFLGLLVYGEGRIGKRMMLFATCMVSLGTTLSVTWIMVANSWMQTPAGYKIVDGQFQPVNWIHVIFNPSFGIRFIHMLLGALISAAWLIAGVSAWYFVKHRHLPLARRGLSIALGALAVILPLQGFIGDEVVSYVAKYKTPQFEAQEGNWKPNTGYNILEIPNQAGPTNYWQVSIPWAGSAISKDWSGDTAIPPLSETPKNLRPQILTTFYGFRVMWFGWLLMLAVAMVGVILRLRGRLYSTRWFHKLLLVMIPSGILAVWGGWVLAETGRQPWLVYGKLLTAAAVSPLKPGVVLTTFVGFILIYVALLATYVWYVARAVREGPGDEPLDEPPVPSLRPVPRGVAPVG